MKKYLAFFLASVGSLGIIYGVEKYAYIYASAFYLLYCAVAFFLNKNEKFKLFHVYLGSLTLAFMVAEIRYNRQIPFYHDYELTYGNGVSGFDDTLGVVAVRNSQRVSQVRFGDSTLYKVTQTIDEYGRRLLPKSSPATKKAVMFFGCSFTFGDGVEDHEVMPYKFQEAMMDRYKVVNYAYSGYGAHQMLGILDNEMEKEGLHDYLPKYAIYQGITDHVFRGTFSTNERMGPTYRLDENGALRSEGVVSQNQGRLTRYLGKSKLFARIFYQRQESTQEDLDLFVAMVKKSADIIASRYQAKFFCLLWEEHSAEEGLYDKILSGLKENDIAVIEVKNILPDYEQRKDDYLLYLDRHPNALAHQFISDYLLQFISQRDSMDNQ